MTMYRRINKLFFSDKNSYKLFDFYFIIHWALNISGARTSVIRPYTVWPLTSKIYVVNSFPAIFTVSKKSYQFMKI
jgi:hypothetical protein